MTVTLPTAEVQRALNEDPEFLHAARYWTAGIKFMVGDQDYFLGVEDGKVARFDDEWDQFVPYDIAIGGPAADWEIMLQPAPPPFYHDFFGVFFRHDFEMGGDLESLYSHYDAVRRVLDLLRATVNQEA